MGLLTDFIRRGFRRRKPDGMSAGLHSDVDQVGGWGGPGSSNSRELYTGRHPFLTQKTLYRLRELVVSTELLPYLPADL